MIEITREQAENIIYYIEIYLGHQDEYGEPFNDDAEKLQKFLKEELKQKDDEAKNAPNG